jgi:branched-chain amino acid transport system substrate-binding protein
MRTTTKWLHPAIGLAALTMLATACGSSGGGGGGGGGSTPTSSAPAKIGNGTLKVGYVLPETGQLAFLGPPQIDGVKYAVQQINAAGGVLGKQVPPPVGGDEAGDAAVAQQSADRVLSSGVQAIIGAAASGMTLAIINKIVGANVVECSGSNTAPTFTTYKDNGYYFRTAPSDALQGPVLAQTVVGDGHSKVAIVARADDYGKGLADATAKSLQQSGATVVLNQTYDPNTTDFSALIQKVASAKPDAVVVIAFEEGKQILKGLIEVGYGPGKVGVYGADGLNSPQLPKLVDPKNPGVLAGMKGTAPTSVSNPQFTAAIQKFDPKLKALQYAPQTFDCMTIIALAAEQAKTNDPKVFKNFINGITEGGTKCTSYAACKQLIDQGKDIAYQGASGTLDFTPAGEPGQATIQVYAFDKAGKESTVKTVESKPVS